MIIYRSQIPKYHNDESIINCSFVTLDIIFLQDMDSSIALSYSFIGFSIISISNANHFKFQPDHLRFWRQAQDDEFPSLSLVCPLMWYSRKYLLWCCCRDNLILPETDRIHLREAIQESVCLFLLSFSAVLNINKTSELTENHLWGWPFGMGYIQVWIVIWSTSSRGRPVSTIEGTLCLEGLWLAPSMSQNEQVVSLQIQ